MFIAPTGRALERVRSGLVSLLALSRLASLASVLLIAVGAPAARGDGEVRVAGIRHSTTAERTRIVLDLSGPVTFRKSESADPPAVIVELDRARFDAGVNSFLLGDGRVLALRLLPPDRLSAQVIVDLAGRRTAKVFPVPAADGKSDRLVIDVFGAPLPAVARGAPEAESARATPADPSALADPSTPAPAPSAAAAAETRAPAVPSTGPAPGLSGKGPAAPARPRVVVLDPGHGGHDTGARGHGGLREKDVCLALAKAVAAELNRRPGYKVVLTRDRDVFLHLRQRTRIAAEHKADLFVSIHCNASRSKSARGTEVYFLSLRGASDEAASEVAMRENAADHVAGVPAASQDEIEDILVDLLRASALERSSELAVTVIEHLRAEQDLELRGVKQAGFDVLKTAGMPSILIESAFISHPKEAKLLKNRDFQRRFAARVASAVDIYLDRAMITDLPAPASRPVEAPAGASPAAAGS